MAKYMAYENKGVFLILTASWYPPHYWQMSSYVSSHIYHMIYIHISYFLTYIGGLLERIVKNISYSGINGFLQRNKTNSLGWVWPLQMLYFGSIITCFIIEGTGGTYRYRCNRVSGLLTPLWTRCEHLQPTVRPSPNVGGAFVLETRTINCVE